MTRLAAALMLFLALTGLSACTPQADVEAGIGSALQESVASIATTAAQGDPSTALAQLDALEQAVLQATAEGRITSGRAAQIGAAIELVRSDLQDQLEALESTTAPVDEPENSAENGNGNGNGNGNRNGNGKKDD